jgi:hypothetical protein
MNFDNMMQSELSIDFLMSYYDNYDIFYRFYDTFYDCNYMNERFTNSNGSLNVYFKCPKYLEKKYLGFFNVSSSTATDIR